jgi:multiple sugar transport system substrate-binding protein
MKMKRVMSMMLAGVMVFSMAACGKSDSKGGDSADSGSGKLVVWTLSEDLKSFAEHYMETNKDVQIETVIIPPADYTTKLSAALRGKAATPDIIVGEPQMLPDFEDAGYFENLSEAPYNANDYSDKLVDYVWEAGKDADGNVRAISYQATPGGIYYRRDIAQDVYGTDDPEEISKKFKDYATIEQTAQEVRDKGYRIFSDTGSLRWFAISDPWVVDGKINITDEKMEYMDTAVDIYQNKLVAFAPEWSAAWFASMAGPIPMNAEWQELDEVDANAEQTEVFAYALPSWGSLTIRDNAKDNAGNYGVCAGPTSYFGGGTFVGISAYSKNKTQAWDFVKYVTLTEDTSKWWAETSKGDIVSMKSVLEEYKDKENEAYGNQKTYQFFYDEAQKIDYSTVTRYDDQLKTFFGAAIESVQKGEKTKDEALKEFYSKAKSAYPELTE